MVATQKGVLHAFHSGHQYRPVSFSDDTATFRCVHAKCPARLKVTGPLATVTKDHIHPDNPRTLLVAKAKHEIKNAAKTQTGVRPTAIVAQTLSRQNEGMHNSMF